MRIQVILLLFSFGTFLQAEDDSFRAKLNVNQARNLILTEQRMMYLPAIQHQKGKAILFEAEQMHGLSYNFPNNRMQKTMDRTSIINVRFLEFYFDVISPGNYRAWYYAVFPTNQEYEHAECMDGGEAITVQDSLNLSPNAWRWHKGPVYSLTKGRHVWSFPSPNAWCGGTALDRLLLVPEELARGEESLADAETLVQIPESGELSLRRIKAKLLKKWRLSAGLELNGGRFTLEFSYDNRQFRNARLGEWEDVPNEIEYLFIRFRLERSETLQLSPFIHDIELRVQERS